MRPIRFLPAALLASLLLPGGKALADSEIHVVTSLKPVELMVRAVATPEVRITTLVPGGASPHTYQMRPSERQALADAHVIFWIGPGMETFLERILSGPDFADRAVALAPEGLLTGEGDGDQHAKGEHEEHAREDHGHDKHDHDEHGHEEKHRDEHHHDDHHGHDHGGTDPHLWLDPALALTMAAQIRDALAAQTDLDRTELDANLARFREDMATKEAQIRKQLEPARDISIFTYHDAFSRFAGHYGLNIAGVLTPSPERNPGARHLARVQEQLGQASQPCLLTEPQFSRQWWRSLTDEVELSFSTWDPLATDIEADRDGYLAFQQSLADSVLACLPEQAQD